MASAGVSVSAGFTPNRLLAEIAAGRDGPRGHAVIEAAAAPALLAGPRRPPQS